MSDWVLDVSGLNEYVSRQLQSDSVLRSLRIRGEVSGFKAYPSGHWYFTLKDERCRISCVMFRSNAMRMSIRPREGDSVVLHGAVRLYEEGGTYQFVADSMRPEGVGSLYQRFEQLKAKLQQEGLFDTERKRPLPRHPRKIAIVTSEAGAVLHDICNVASKRDPSIPLVLVPVPVQGDGAAELIAEGIALACTLSEVDVVICGRGGGSIEDLWPFNEEVVARAIAASVVPVISAVGHETDFTIADFVADVRAATPTQAAEFAIADRKTEKAAIDAMKRRLHAAVNEILAGYHRELDRLHRRCEAVNPSAGLNAMRQRQTALRARMDQLVQEKLSAYPARLSMASIRLENAVNQKLERTQLQLRQRRIQLEMMNPQRTLERGYVMVSNGDRIISDAVNAPEHMTLHFHDGTIQVLREKGQEHGSKEKADI